MQAFRTLLLDADDTLFDFAAAQRQAFAHALAGTPYQGEAERLSPLFARINQALWARQAKGEVDQAYIMAHRFEALCRAENLACNPNELNRRFLDGLSQSAVLLAGAGEAVARWSGMARLAILTNGVARVQRSRLARSPLAPYLSALIISEEVGRPKPHPDMVLAAMKALGETETGAVLLVGDSLAADIGAARAAGVSGCWFAPGGGQPHGPNLPDFVARSYQDITNLLQGESAAAVLR